MQRVVRQRHQLVGYGCRICLRHRRVVHVEVRDEVVVAILQLTEGADFLSECVKIALRLGAVPGAGVRERLLERGGLIASRRGIGALDDRERLAALVVEKRPIIGRLLSVLVGDQVVVYVVGVDCLVAPWRPGAAAADVLAGFLIGLALAVVDLVRRGNI